uniref:Uncharacterized protein n=1 Tax=Anguilla anguilla TaxID=7936 RepID=A0A0E9QVU4_ANGAN
MDYGPGASSRPCAVFISYFINLIDLLMLLIGQRFNSPGVPGLNQF